MRRLAARLGGRAVFGGLSAILEAERDLPFAAALVQALNLILLTSPEARPPPALSAVLVVTCMYWPSFDHLCTSYGQLSAGRECAPHF